jgi:uncharacterized protein
MKLNLESSTGGYTIRAYAAGQVTVNDETLTRSFIISPAQLIRDWPPQTLDELAEQHLEMVATMDPDVVLIGSGSRLRFPPTVLLIPLYTRNIGVEVMDTGAACRTYNVLLAEGRQVAAALLMI